MGNRHSTRAVAPRLGAAMLTVSLLAGALSVVTAGPALADSNATTGIAITNVTPSLSDAGGLDVTGLCVPDWGGVTVQ